MNTIEEQVLNALQRELWGVTMLSRPHTFMTKYSWKDAKRMCEENPEYTLYRWDISTEKWILETHQFNEC